MQRDLLNYLITWKEKSRHLPLLIRGARQVGKTYLVEHFGQQCFQDYLTINFELQPEYKACFDSLNPEQILQAITLISKHKIIPGKTLLFLDEIQECPRAIMALRYFKELLPDLHVIGAGSLLEFTLKDSGFSMPVGRIQFLYLQPLSFREFLKIHNYTQLDEFLSAIKLGEEIPTAIHNKLLTLLREYMMLGGMPAVHQTYLENNDITECQSLQTAILTSYRNDFNKYSHKSLQPYLEVVFKKTPALIGQQVKYSDIEPGMRSRELKEAIHTLHKAGVLYQVFASTSKGLPISAFINPKKFKLIYLDIGLINRSNKLDLATLLREDIHLLNRGALAEQFVGQELLAYMPQDEERELLYWARDKVGSMAEVDFIIQWGKYILPIEVKSGKTGRLKSLQLFLQETQSPLGIRFSANHLNLQDDVLTIPLYLVSEYPRLIQSVLEK